MRATIGIIEPRYVVAVGLREVLSNLFTSTDIAVYTSFESCEADIVSRLPNRPYFVHFFVADSILIDKMAFFKQLPQMCFAIVDSGNRVLPDFPVINIRCSEEQMYEQLFSLHRQGQGSMQKKEKTSSEVLSAREIEVLQGVAKGKLNKEIADELCLALPTVITHRRHIVNKLGIRSVAALTVYAVMHGYVNYEDITI